MGGNRSFAQAALNGASAPASGASLPETLAFALFLPVLSPFSLRRVKGFASASKTELCAIISGVASPAFSPKASMNDKYKEIGAGFAFIGTIVSAFLVFMDRTGISGDIAASYGVAIKD